jgi:hypothetical protein
MQKGTIEVEMPNGQSLKVEVNILETRKMFGRTEYLVTPVAGEGQVWKEQVIIKQQSPITNKEWHYYPEHGSYYRMIDNVLWVTPASNTGERIAEDEAPIDYNLIDMSEALECKKIERELALKELV